MSNVVDKRALPAELTSRAQWVAWRRWTKDDGKVIKLPIDVKTGKAASVSDPLTWASFETARSCCVRAGLAGVGYVFSADDTFTGYDIDGCRDPYTGVVEAWAYDLVVDLGTYAEVSPSGKGIKGFAIGKLPGPGANNGRVELYDQRRFFAITGQQVPGTPLAIVDCSAKIDALYRGLFPEKLGERRRAEPVPEKIAVGQRHSWLVSLAGTLRNRGLNADEIAACLIVVNESRCAPPGDVESVRAIAESVAKYPPVGVGCAESRTTL